jgi:predicted small secreted protein
MAENVLSLGDSGLAMRTFAALVLGFLAVSFTLSGCGNEGDGHGPEPPIPGPGGPPSSAICASITGGTSKVSHSVDPGCIQCSATNVSAAADSDFESAATLTVNAPAGQGVAIRATAQAGIVFPARSVVAVVVRDPDAQSGPSTIFITHLIRTYLAEQLQESPAPTQINRGPKPGNGDAQAYSLTYRTNKPFDAVELFISNSQVTGTPQFKIYEICSDLSD